jgi:5-methyltetrahydropteroyltriglutamate--homocysteine methyltransferase
MINSAIAGHPANLRITMHLCRGNFRSSWIAQGGYEPVADLLFNTIGVDGYFMEYDTERAGGFEPLRHVPKKARRWRWACLPPKTAMWNPRTRSSAG